MGTDPSAKLFYGYINPNDEEEQESSWGDATEYNPDAVCGVELFGYDGFIRYGLAVTASVKRSDWSDATLISSDHITRSDDSLGSILEWNAQLDAFANEKGIDISGLTPGWYLVSLYF